MPDTTRVPKESGESSPGLQWIERREEQRGWRPRDAAYLIIAIWLVTVVVFGVLEHLLDKQTFPTVWLAMWWVLQTVTTVGYGDVVPRSTTARLVGSVLLLGGLALISVVTATITSGLVARVQRARAADAGTTDELLREIRELRTRVDQLHSRRPS
jgi:voltage-gated potassium channel